MFVKYDIERICVIEEQDCQSSEGYSNHSSHNSYFFGIYFRAICDSLYM